jgi:Fungalysin metallopeptidase (M36)
MILGWTSLFSLLVFTYQNCGKGFQIDAESVALLGSQDGKNNNGNGSGNTNTGTAPPAGVLTKDCMTNNTYNTCIFYKNPVAQNKGPLASGPITLNTDLSDLQIFGVNISGLDNSGFLQNTTFVIDPTIRVNSEDIGFAADTGAALRATTGSVNWKFEYAGDANHRVGQVMAYYWLDTQRQLMASTTGGYYTSGKKVLVDTWNPGVDNNAFWVMSGEQGYIVMGAVTDAGGAVLNPMSLSADVYAHEAGHGNLDYAMRSRTGGGRCTSNVGCIGAIHEGQADYHAAILFAENPNIGETFFNNLSGLVSCNVSRDVRQNPNLTVTNAFNACGTATNRTGQPHIMGAVYASIWWQVRNLATSNKQEVDTLFTEHLKSITSTDTFVNAYSRIIAADSVLYKGKYAKAFYDQFTSRGLNVPTP